MKFDVEFKCEIEVELVWDLVVKDIVIGVVVRNGVVMFSGYVDIYFEKWVVEKVLKWV